MSHLPGLCPICKKTFTSNDDIVYCPECGAPYHRACYTQQGQCSFAEKHASGFEYSAPNPVGTTENDTSKKIPGYTGDTILCKACGNTNKSSNIFCEKCGAPLHTNNPIQENGGAPNPFSGLGFDPFSQPMDMEGSLDDIPKKDWARFIGNNANSYLFRYAQQDMRHSKLGVLMSVFFLGPYYFAYRKMWGWALLSFVLYILTAIPGFLQIMVDNSNPLVAGLSVGTVEIFVQAAFIVNMVVRLASSFLALALYRKHASKKIKALQSAKLDKDVYNISLEKKGGVSIIGLIAILLVQLALYALVYPYIGADVLAYFNSGLL